MRRILVSLVLVALIVGFGAQWVTPVGAGSHSISISPSNGPPLTTTITVTGIGFTPSTSVTITFDGTAVVIANADTSGSFSRSFTVPPSPRGGHTITADGANAGFDVTASASLSRSSGLPGELVSVTGEGFDASQSNVSITFDVNNVGSGSTNSTGTLSASFTVPSVSAGDYTVSVGNLVDITFSVSGPPLPCPGGSGGGGGGGGGTPDPGDINTIAGKGIGDGGQAINATLSQPFGVAVDSSGNLFIADRDNLRIRRVDGACGGITTVAGNGSRGFLGDNGPAINAPIVLPEDVAVDATGNLFIAHPNQARVRRVDAITGVITTVAGNATATGSIDGEGGDPADDLGDSGLAISASLSRSPEGVAVDSSGNLFIADTGNQRIRRVDAKTQIITTVAGSGPAGEGGFSGDGGPATSARLRGPQGVAVDGAGNLFIADAGNNRVRKVETLRTEGSISGRVLQSDGLTPVVGATVRIRDFYTGSCCFEATTAADGTYTVVNLPTNDYRVKVNAASQGFVRENYDGAYDREGAIPVPVVSPKDTANIDFILEAGGSISGHVFEANGVTPVSGVTVHALDFNQGFGIDQEITQADGSYTLAGLPAGSHRVQADATHLGFTFECYQGDALCSNPTSVVVVASQETANIDFTLDLAPVISTVVGIGPGFGGDGSAALNSRLSHPERTALDSSGNLYFADRGNHRVRKIDAATGTITTVAGSESRGLCGDDGLAVNACLNWPTGVAVDSSDNLFIADSENRRVRRVDRTTGIITTVAGSDLCCSTGDGGPAIHAGLDRPNDVAVDAVGNLYIVDRYANRVWRVDATTQIITTVAGTGDFAFSGDGGPATAATFAQPVGIGLDGSGNLLYIADKFNQRVRQVDLTNGIITTAAGSGTPGFCGDGGPAIDACLRQPSDVAVDAGGNLFIADPLNNAIRQVASGGIIASVAGNDARGSRGDEGPATDAEMGRPMGISVDRTENLYITDMFNHRIRKVDAGTGIITRFAGEFPPGFRDGVLASNALLDSPQALYVDSVGDLIISDKENHRIRKVDSTSRLITTIAGNGTPTGSIDGEGGDPTDDLGDGGLAINATVNEPRYALADAAGNIFIADITNRIRRVDASSGIITTFAGNGSLTGSIDGEGGDPLDDLGDGGIALEASLSPLALALDSSVPGYLYLTDRGNNRVRRINLETNIITTYAGNGVRSFCGDGIPATSACINPRHIALDTSGNLFIADRSNHRVRKVDAFTQVITTVAGNGISEVCGDGGPASAACVGFANGVTVDYAGNLFISSQATHRIRKVDAISGVITAVAGSGLTEVLDGSYTGDGGPATSATLAEPWGIAVDNLGNLLIADSDNHVVRQVGGVATVPPRAEVSLGLHQGLPDGATGFKVDVTRVFDPASGNDVPTQLGSFQANLTYPDLSSNPSFPVGTPCVNLLEIRDMDFAIAADNIDNANGMANFNGFSTGGETAPTDLVQILTRLTGSAIQPCRVDLKLTALTDVDGNPVGIDNPFRRTVLRGDARADGNINIADALFIAQYLVGLRDACTTADTDTTCLHSVNTASVREDGAFDEKTIADALFIAQFLVGLRDEFYNFVP